MKLLRKIVMGGGILVSAILLLIPLIILSNLSAIELSSISGCGNNQHCKITSNYDIITNSGNHTAGASEGIEIEARIGTFINYGKIVGSGQQIFTFRNNGYVEHFINYGTMYDTNRMGLWVDNGVGIGTITNYGIMGSINYGANSFHIPTMLTLNNFGLIGANNAHIYTTNRSKILIQNYMVMISETATTFNSFTTATNNNFSHLVISTQNNGSISFKDENSKIILDFDNGFEFGKKYLISKVATDQNGNAALGVNFNRLTPYNDLYHITQSGDSFVVNLKPESSTIGNLYKSNVRTMNNFYTISNSMIYPHKFAKKRVVKKRRVIRRVKKVANLFNMDCFGKSCNSPRKDKWVESSLQTDSNATLSSLRENERSEFSWQSTDSIDSLESLDFIDSLESLESHESFAYKSDLNNYANNSTTNQNRTNRTTTPRRITTTNRTLSNPSNDKYYFILTPFLNHNLFFESGRYNLSGLEYGFLTAFSGKLNNVNALGTHFMMSYGSLGDNDTNQSKGDRELILRVLI